MSAADRFKLNTSPRPFNMEWELGIHMRPTPQDKETTTILCVGGFPTEEAALAWGNEWIDELATHLKRGGR
jgi:hypothetical protein